MIVKSTISACWKATPEQLAAARKQLAAILAAAPDGTEIFYRADDIGVPGEKCQRMMELHRKHLVPLHMAVTPAWLTESRWRTLAAWGGDHDLWCWHQHGWRHVTHQKTGKKGEFGSDRSREAKASDLTKGCQRLRAVMGESFAPVFTPPWNRFDDETAHILQEQGYRAVSRSGGEQKKVPLPEGLPDIPINVDLHTRSESTPEASLNALLSEFERAVDGGRIGVMLHHQRMNDAAFDFLDACLALTKNTPALTQIRLDLL